MDIWLERFVLALLVAGFVSLVMLNVMKFDTTQRVTLAISIIAFSYFVGHTIVTTRAKRSPNMPPVQHSAQVPTSVGPAAQAKSLTLAVQVTDDFRKPVPGANVLLLNADGTHLRMATTDENGVANIYEEIAGPITVFCARDGFHYYRRSKFEVRNSLLPVQMSANPIGGSVIIPDGTGYVPGLDGRLNPILDGLGRTYLYAENIAIEGGKAQPVQFSKLTPFGVKDSRGQEFQLQIVDIVGSSALIEYARS